MRDPYGTPPAGWAIADLDEYLFDRAVRIHIVDAMTRGELNPRVPHVVRVQATLATGDLDDAAAALPGSVAHAVVDGTLVAFTAIADPQCEALSDAVDLVCQQLHARRLPTDSIRVSGVASAASISDTARTMQQWHLDIGLAAVRPLGLARIAS